MSDTTPPVHPQVAEVFRIVEQLDPRRRAELVEYVQELAEESSGGAV